MDLLKIKDIKWYHIEELCYIGIDTVENLIKKCSNPYNLNLISQQTKIDRHLLQNWLKSGYKLKKVL